MATEADVEQLFASLAPRIEEINKRDVPHRTGGNLGCLLMVLPFVAGVVLLMALNRPDTAEIVWGWPLIVAPVIGAVSFFVGLKMHQPWANVNAGQREQGSEVALQPLAALLLPGSTFTLAPIQFSGYHPSLLTAGVSGVTSTYSGRIEGRLLGVPIRIDELRMDYDDERPAHWMAEVELPFVLDGHVRIHRRTMLTAGIFWNDGFDPLDDESRRLGRGWKVQLAPLGVGTEEGLGPAPPGAVPPTVVLTEGLFAVLRDRQDIWVAATARTLWIFVERSIRAFDSQVPSLDDVRDWKKAAVAMQDVEAVTREVLAAASVRG